MRLRSPASLVIALLLAPSPALAQRASDVFGGREIAAPSPKAIPYLRRLPTEAEIREVVATAPELQSTGASAGENNGPQGFNGAAPATRVQDVRVDKWHMPGAQGATNGSFAVVKLTTVLLRGDGGDGPRLMQALFLGYRKPDGKLGVLAGFLPGDKPGQLVAAPIVQGRSAEERDRRLAEVIAGALPGFAGGPERVQITVASALARGSNVHVTGSILSATPITSTLFLRTEGGDVKQGFLGVTGTTFSASCERAPGVGNVFKITADNEARLGAEVTLAFDRSGKLLDVRTTSVEGDVTTEAARPPAGLGGAGQVPGPATPAQAAAGILTPALLGLLLHGLLGGRGDEGPTPPPPVPPGGKGRRHHAAAPAASDHGDDGEDAGDGHEAGGPDGKGTPAGEGKGQGPAAKGPGGPVPKAEGPRGAAPEKPAPGPVAAGPGAPAAPAAASPEKEALDRLAWLDNRAKRSHSDALTKALADARASCFRPDGSLDADRWKDSQRALWDALGAYGRQGETPNSFLGDAAREIGYAPVEAIRMAGGAAVGLVKGVGALAVSGAKGVRDIADGVRHAGYFLTGAKAKTNEWVAKNCPEESKALQAAVMAGRPLEALASMARTAGVAGGQLLGAAGRFIKTEVLPVEEIESFFDKDASLEQRLWAVPAAATKIAGLLLLGAKPTAVPSTRIGGAISGARTSAAAEAAAAQKVAQLRTQVATLEKVATRSGAGPEAGGVGAVLDRTKEALARARQAEQTAAAARRVEGLVPQAVKDAPILNLRDAMRRVDGSPELRRAADDAIRANRGGGSLYGLRVEGALSKDAHTLVTARKLQLQEQAMNNATKRILQEEVAARQAAGQPVPTRFDTFNASQGSRSRISGANVNADYDQTVTGVQHVDPARTREIVRQECRRLRQTQETLDVNVYQPRRGLSDAGGSAPNSQATLENIGQTTGTAGQHSVHVTRDNRVVISDHVSTPDGREGVLAGRRTLDPPPGVSREQWLREGAWEGHQGQPVQVPREQWPAVREAQLDGLQHAFERGDMNQMVKYANRARSVGLPMSESTEGLLRAVAGEKDPLVARQILSSAGFDTPADLMRHLGLS